MALLPWFLWHSITQRFVLPLQLLTPSLPLLCCFLSATPATEDPALEKTWLPVGRWQTQGSARRLCSGYTGRVEAASRGPLELTVESRMEMWQRQVGESSISGGRKRGFEGGTEADNRPRFLKQQIGLSARGRGRLWERQGEWSWTGVMAPGLGEPLVLIQPPLSLWLFFIFYVSSFCWGRQYWDLCPLLFFFYLTLFL